MTTAVGHLSEEQLLSALKEAEACVGIGKLYRHYRSSQGAYRVTGLGIIEATQEVGVVYRKEGGSEALQSMTWIRPLSSWCEAVDFEGTKVPRFQKIAP